LTNTLDKTILFSGRFDKPELGHIITIGRLAQKYKKVIVCILDYEEARWPVSYKLKVFEDCFKVLEHSERIHVIVNNVHFAKITIEELESVAKFDVYGAGNNEVLKHIESLGVECVYVPRYMDYAATPGRVYDKIKGIMESET